MELGHTEIFVQNPLKSKDFYVDILGFELIEIQAAKFVWLKSGDKQILLRPGLNEIPALNYQRANIALVLYTDNLVQTKNKLMEKGLEFKGTDGSENCLTFTDLDGNWFQLVEFAEHN